MFEQLKLRNADQKQCKEHLDRLLPRINKDFKKDWISHFVLRLAYCRTEDLRRWFLTQEVALLKWRLGHAAAGSTTNALSTVLPEATLVPQRDLEGSNLMADILASTPGIKMESKIYQVPFIHALDLVEHRQVFVRGGKAFVPESRLVNLVTARFRASLSRQLVLLSAVPTTPGLQRTQGFLKNVTTVHTVNDQFQADSSNVTNLNSNNVPAHLKHMPLCMAQLQMALQKEKHLKHWGRLQYGLFLKGAGLSLEDALIYFERMFAGKGFSKEYAYNWRHMYGKEGKRANYPPYSCAKVINGNAPNANEHHGCPYKHGTVQDVTNLLSRLGVTAQQQKGIIAQQQSHNYQLACVEHFKATHPNIERDSQVQTDNLGNHPNAWFHASVSIDKLNHGDDDKLNVNSPTGKGTLDDSPPSMEVSP